MALRPELGRSCQNLQVKKAEEQMMSIGVKLDSETMETLFSILKENSYIFVWKSIDMPNIDPHYYLENQISKVGLLVY